jgi:hypothetical protein
MSLRIISFALGIFSYRVFLISFVNFIHFLCNRLDSLRLPSVCKIEWICRSKIATHCTLKLICRILKSRCRKLSTCARPGPLGRRVFRFCVACISSGSVVYYHEFVWSREPLHLMRVWLTSRIATDRPISPNEIHGYCARTWKHHILYA